MVKSAKVLRAIERGESLWKRKGKFKGTWLKVFCPEARCLTEEEEINLPKSGI